MSSARYLLVDVFTDKPFGGNPLAVFLDGEDVPERLMQRIARELNLSETTFVLPPEDPANLCRLRIFTPLEELPMAGHPTVGSAFALAVEGRIEAPSTIRFEEGVGVVPVEVEGDGGSTERRGDGATAARVRAAIRRRGPHRCHAAPWTKPTSSPGCRSKWSPAACRFSSCRWPAWRPSSGRGCGWISGRSC